MLIRTLALFVAMAYLAPMAKGDESGRTGDSTGVTEKLLFDFSTDDQVAVFRPINDGVMGGLSDSRMTATAESTAVFAGVLSLENNGGFASVRTSPQPFGLKDFTGLKIRVRGDGRTYKLRLRTDASFDGVAWQADFAAGKDEWLELYLPFDAFTASFRGRAVPDAPPLDPGGIQQLGFMIADRRPGPFRLEIARVIAVKRAATSGSGQ